jgi:hypothetical protein
VLVAKRLIPKGTPGTLVAAQTERIDHAKALLSLGGVNRPDGANLPVGRPLRKTPSFASRKVSSFAADLSR